MARLIPPSIPPRASRGERELFHALRDDPSTDGWVVFHSLDVRRHLTKIEGEIDLIVLVPGSGVLCLEVKACDVARRGGIWIYPYGTSSEGPFKQVSRAMHSLREWITGTAPQLKNLLFFSAVAFTEIHFDIRSPEWHTWQVINSRDLLRSSPARLIVDILDRAHTHIRTFTPHWYDAERSRPSASAVLRFADILRADFDYRDSGRSEVKRIERAIEQATNEQLDALDQLTGNDRVILKGLAGTGKTWLALAAAQDAVRAGRSTALFCYNRLLGEWLFRHTADLRREAEQAGVSFYAGTFHRFLLQSGGKIPTEPGQKFWDDELPARVIDRLLSPAGHGHPQFDQIIMDEAQDLVRPAFLDVFDLILTGGMGGGKWVMCGDFERQVIYGSGQLEPETRVPALVRSRSPSFATLHLGTNCRNSKVVAETVSVVAGLAPGYRRLLREADSGTVDPRFFSSPQDQAQRLRAEISRLLMTYRPEEIVILSPRSPDRCCAASTLRSGAPLPVAISELRGPVPVPGETGYTTIHSFKGLEAPAIIVTDIDDLDAEQAATLLYVAMSRARVHLTLLMHQSLNTRYQQLLRAQLRQSAAGSGLSRRSFSDVT